MSFPPDTSFGEIDEAYARLNSRFASRATIPLEYRLYNLKQLAYLIKDNEAAICEAVRADAGDGEYIVKMRELFGVINEIELAVRKLPTWAKDESRWWDSMLTFKFMNPRVRKQPKGVILIISPWNFPWQLTLIPLVNAIAAGCPVVIKPSELSPHSSALMARLIPRYLDPEGFAVVLGGVEQSSYLLEKGWGHIMYTGSGRVGIIVAEAAAKTLTPTTLELGGKSPVVVSSCADVKKAARRLFTIKQLASGQMCVTPDYVLVAEDRVDDFVKACIDALETFFPHAPSIQSILASPFFSHLQSSQSFQRQLSFVQKAKSEGKLVYQGEIDEEKQKMGFSLVKLNPGAKGEGGGLVEEEIFGMVLPIIPVKHVDEAIAYINDRPHPLALYVCSSKRSVWTKVVNETTSGSASWNDFAFATANRALPFGGIGESGWGNYHGYDGFKTFSHFKSTLEIPLIFELLMSLRYPPMSNLAKYILPKLLTTGINFARPSSVEDEGRRLRWRKWWRLFFWVFLVGSLKGVFYLLVIWGLIKRA